MSAVVGAPEAGTYKFVLRRRDGFAPEIPEQVTGYTESPVSRDVTHPDGLRRRTVYLNDQALRDRLLRLGWEDVTELRSATTTAPPKRRSVVRIPG